MSKQRKDQKPQSTPGDDAAGRNASDDANTPNADAATSSSGGRTTSTAADTSTADNARSAQPIKPDVAKPEAKDEPSSAHPRETGADTSPASASSSAATTSTGAAVDDDAPASSTGKSSSAKASSGKGAAAAGTGAGTKEKAGRPAGPYARGGGGGGTPPAAGGGESRSGGGGNTLGLIALVLMLLLALVVAILGYQGWQRLQQQQAQLDQVGNNRSAIGQLESRLDDVDQNRQQTLNMMRGEFDEYRQSVDQTLDDVLDELAQQQEADPREWLHAEAEYLLRLANQRLQLERDVEGAKALLNTADDRLREADNPALVPIRRAIQSELAALDSVPSVDRTGLYLALMAQQEQLARLPLKQDIEQIAADSADTQPAGGWREQLATLGSELKDLVTVRRHDQPLEALITPEQESYLRQNVRLLLEQAQLALLKAEPELYQASLDKAIELVSGYYATERDGVQNALDKLASLRDTQVRPELPDISESSQLLKRFIEQRFGNGSGGSQSGSAQGDDT